MTVFAGVCVFALAACSGPDTFDGGSDEVEDRSETGGGGTAKTLAEASEDRAKRGADKAASAKADDFKDNEKSGKAEREFSYSWPKQVSAIPGLAKLLGEKRAEALTSQKKEWKESVDEFGTDGCTSCVTRDFSTEWKVVTDLSRFLSLSSGSYIYGGGAHGNSFTDSLIWDRKAEASINTTTLFKSTSALWDAARDDYCKALDKVRAERRGEPVQEGGYGSECPGLDELTLMAGSSDGKTFNRLGLVADPYVAGAYAEGTYEVTLPVTNAILDAVKPEYREYFSAK
ncbi:MAG: DUF4163 domain-containing protein [Erythrobacter sp.]